MYVKINTQMTTDSTVKSQRKLENTLRLMKMKIQHQNLWDAAKAVIRGKFIAVKNMFQKKGNIKSVIKPYTLKN